MSLAANAGKADELMQKLGASVKKVEAAAGSSVKLKGAETGYLEIVEQVRDMFKNSVKAPDDKSRVKLMDVFGGDCARIAALRADIEAVQLSDMYKSDKRPPEAIAALCCIEDIIREKGMAKQLAEAQAAAKRRDAQPPAQPPAPPLPVDPAVEGKWFTDKGDTLEISQAQMTFNGEPVTVVQDPKGIISILPKGGKDPKKKGKLILGDKVVEWDDGSKWMRERPKPVDPKLEGEWYTPDGAKVVVQDGKATMDGKPVDFEAGDGKVNMTDSTGKKKGGKLLAGDKVVAWDDGHAWSREKPAPPDPSLEGEWFLPDGKKVTVSKDGVAKLPDGSSMKLNGQNASSNGPGKCNMADPNNPTTPQKTGKVNPQAKGDDQAIEWSDGSKWARKDPTVKTETIVTSAGTGWNDPYDEVKRDIVVELGCEVAPQLDWGEGDSFVVKVPSIRGKLTTTVTPPLPEHPKLKPFQATQYVDLPEFSEIATIVFDPVKGTPERAQFKKTVEASAIICDIPECIEAKVGSRALQPWGAKKLKEGNDITELNYEVFIEEAFALDSEDDVSKLSVTLTYTFDCKLTGAGSAKFQPDGKPIPPPPSRK
jgi:hypothetical protein